VLLEKLGFARPRQFQRVGSLSGGERRRLHLASVLVARPNVLILDGARARVPDSQCNGMLPVCLPWKCPACYYPANAHCPPTLSYPNHNHP
jgi:ABC-type ATPase involved in cell division